jgi:uncharacterized membrane protein
MPRTDFIEQLRRRLVDLGCPLVHVRRLVQEVADHREDLKQAALSEGLSGADAEARADAQLGNPLDLAERLAMAQRQSSWWGRHFVVGFCLVPLLAVPALWALLLASELSLGFALGYGWDAKRLHAAVDNAVAFRHLTIGLHCADLVAIALVTLLFCWLARRSAVSFKWTVVACSICSLYALFGWVTVVPHSIILGVTSTPQWIRSAIPLLVAGTIYTFRLRAARGLDENAVA